jgi:predicted SAM-dependent methyltransferase
VGFSVWFERSLTATHIEGATRGRTPREKRELLGAEKHAREVVTIGAFRKKHSDESMAAIDAQARTMNLEAGIMQLPELKIELGCGNNPQPGYVACDARRVRGVSHVFDFGSKRFPFHDGSVGEILMNHSIEHVSYRQLPHVLNECRRVLAPGGKIIIRTPDLKFICEKYLAGKTTPEWPGDEKWISDNFGGNTVSPAWWANIKLFAGQDYPGNEHRFCFDMDTIKDVLEKFGFSKVERFFDRPIFSPGEIYCEAVKA